ncbi:hypothetical protein EZJ58_5193 [Sodalis ligni]|uniref:Uncharacterized protein n=2 Tax=Sodalis ligni TaxID=2697027 RepID=A0A4R1NQ72_9GAMM|nr:hypothetical protein EZJ58_5193 [Sodalis ligni]
MSIQEVFKTVHIDKEDQDFWRYEISWITPEEKVLVRVSKSLPDKSATQYSSAIDFFEFEIPVTKTPQGKVIMRPNDVLISKQLINRCIEHRESFNK